MMIQEINKMQNLVKATINHGEWICFGDVLKRLGSPKFQSARYEKLYRAWQEMKINGTLTIGVSGLYRVNN